MITQLRLANFQSFAESTEIPLAPVTLIFGPNSSGKSSIIRSLLLLKQSIWNAGMSDILFQGPDIDLGSHLNVVHRHDANSLISVGLSFNADKSTGSGATRVDYEIGSNGVIQSLRQSVSSPKEFKKASRNGKFAKKFDVASEPGQATVHFETSPQSPDTFRVNLELSPGLEALMVAVLSQSSNRETHLPENVQSKKIVEMLESVELEKRSIFADFDFSLPSFRRSSLHEYFTLANLVRKSTNTARFHLLNMTHLGGLRSIPERIAALSSKSNLIAADGSNVVSLLGSKTEMVEIVSRWFERLTNGKYSIALETYSSERINFLGDVGSLVLVDNVLQTATTFRDVGVGLSQVLPILTALVQSNGSDNGSELLLLEQPELHLHPLMQSELVDIIIESSLAKGSDRPQIVLETHSENMVLRIQRRIREGTLSPSDVSVIYVHRETLDGSSQVVPMPFDKNGDFLVEWPVDFDELRVKEWLG